jgi:hypothetical protein
MSFQVLSVASATNSRASSRSKTVPPSDEEQSDFLPATIGRTGRHPKRHEETNTFTSRPTSKRPRNTESQDEMEYPSKRIKLRRPSARTPQVVNFLVVACFPRPYAMVAGQFTALDCHCGGSHSGPTATPAAGYIAIRQKSRANDRASRRTLPERIWK